MDTSDIPDTEEVDLDGEFASTVDADDAWVTTSAVGIVHAEGVSLDRSLSAAVVSKDVVDMSQSGGYWVLARSVEAENTGSAAIVAGNVKVNRGWIGILAAPRAEISEDSRVFIGPSAAAIIGLAIVIVSGIVAAVAPGLLRQAGQQWPDFDKQALEWMREHG